MKNQTLINYEFKIISILWLIVVVAQYHLHKMPSGCASRAFSWWQNIAFGYKGDIYVVNAQGGTAVPITIHEGHDMMPVEQRWQTNCFC
jgi:hypothetical protein